ncbi:MAG TPA: BON domain-containing protein [Telluria sp.]|jgi:osmotically-inducible protein OsmY|nr:BON domain-containing protein [Telluria sp.]
MKPFVATLLATALTAAFSSAYALDATPDNATYRTMTQKAGADYKMAAAKCTGMTGNERAVCVEEAKVTRARANADAVAQYNNTLKARTAARNALANAEYALAKVKCSVNTGAEKDSCLANATSVHVAALADAKADRDVRVAADAGVAVDGKGLVANTRTTDPAKAAAVDKCAQIAGQPSTGCLIDNKSSTVAGTTAVAAANTREAGATVAQKTENMAEAAVDKTKQVASNIADKTERAVDRMAGKSEVAADKSERVAENAAAKTGKVVADSVITTKIKADLFKEPDLSAMAIHVETEKGVVMLSGFVDSKADAEKAVRLAKSVEGVTQVKNAIKVK